MHIVGSQERLTNEFSPVSYLIIYSCMVQGCCGIVYKLNGKQTAKVKLVRLFKESHG